jgi:hypothetical protein
MMTNSLFEVEDQHIKGRIDEFMTRFKIGTLLNRSGIRRLRGVRSLVILRTVFELAFSGRNIYTGVHTCPSAPLGKDAVYRFLSLPSHNWRRLLGFLAQAVIKGFFQPLTNESREDVLILDDTTYDRNHSKEVELLARVHDHTANRYLKGFRMLTLGWSDGASFVPVDHAVLSSTKQKNRIQGITKEMDKRTCGARRRQEAITKSTDLIVPMVRRAQGLFISAKYILMDSWFGFPGIIRSLMSSIDVICMVKNTPKIFYEYEGLSQTVSQIYRKIRKRRGRAKIKASVTVGIGEGKKAKLVFVQRRNRKKGVKWLALLCTDLSLPDEEVARIYGKRWDIEVFFKMAKHYLKLDSEIQVRDFDSILAHSTIVMIRYIFLAVEQRLATDQRTIGALFHAASDEIRDISLTEALLRILSMVQDTLRKLYATSEQLAQQIIETTMKEALALIRPSFQHMCES